MVTDFCAWHNVCMYQKFSNRHPEQKSNAISKNTFMGVFEVILFSKFLWIFLISRNSTKIKILRTNGPVIIEWNFQPVYKKTEIFCQFKQPDTHICKKNRRQIVANTNGNMISECCEIKFKQVSDRQSFKHYRPDLQKKAK